MRARQQFRISIALLVGFQLATALGAIALLSRMTPAIAEILDENQFTIESAQDMLLVIARRSIEPDNVLLEKEFRDALQRAEDNITEPGEPQVVALLERHATDTLAGDPEALRQSIEGVRQLVEINREAMLRADHEARRLGTAGAWTAVILALAALGVSVIVSRRLARNILDPLGELYEVTEAARMGDRYRRARQLDATAEMRRILESINLLLDDRAATASVPEDDPSRFVAIHLLDERPEPSFVVNQKGEVAMANDTGLEALSASDGAKLRQELAAAPTSETAPGRVHSTAIEGAKLWLCIVR